MSRGSRNLLAWITNELERLTRKGTQAYRDTGKRTARFIVQDVEEKLHVDRRGGHEIEKAGEGPRTPEHTEAPPAENSPPPSRLVDRSVPGERYFIQDTASPRLYAEGTVGRNGELQLALRTQLEDGQRSTLLRGAEQFQAILRFFEGKFASINGSWQYGSNLARFNELTASGVSPEVAAARTWTGRQADKAGFRTVKILDSQGDPGKYTTVKVQFTS
ncbi:hypothetical protein IU486_34220 [Streptomyces gardneri]|uniref:hypothetical protein n=1 Tax=Nocardia sputi TaxID=2943705 RepID=UPI0018934B74|nr:hypothetical protein [Nocardia sputi]MBF6169736.1 hypothetical protein [Streptomyces gardneri]UAK31207.1 hypothetical protein K8O92_25715 [Nocardia asteroides]